MSKKEFSIYQFYQFESINGKLTKTDVAFERRCRRWYANELGISFSNTFDLAWTEIVSHYYDNQIEETPFNIVFNMAVDDYCPELAEEEAKADQAFADSLVEEQAETLSKKSIKDKNIKKIDKKEKRDIEMTFEDMSNPDEE